MKSNIKVDVKADLTPGLNDLNKDVILPPAREASSGLTKLIRVVNTVIDNATYKYIANSHYKKEEFLKNIEKKYKDIPQEELTEPDINILGNTLEALKYNLDKDYLVELYSNIIISDMDKRTKNNVRICYVDILKQLDKEDLLILEAMYKQKNTKSMPFGKLSIIDSDGKESKFELTNTTYFAGINGYIIKDYNKFSESIENLERLGLIEISTMHFFTDKNIYDKLLEDVKKQNIELSNKLRERDSEFGCDKGIISISNLGKNLMKICLRDTETK